MLTIMKPSIHTTVKQLFFRLNQQQHRNQKYKKKENIEGESTGSPAPAGHSTDDPIDVDAIKENRNTSMQQML
jgi:hypothetical protein